MVILKGEPESEYSSFHVGVAPGAWQVTTGGPDNSGFCVLICSESVLLMSCL